MNPRLEELEQINKEGGLVAETLNSVNERLKKQTALCEALETHAEVLSAKVFALDAKRNELGRQIAEITDLHAWLNSQRQTAIQLASFAKALISKS